MEDLSLVSIHESMVEGDGCVGGGRLTEMAESGGELAEGGATLGAIRLRHSSTHSAHTVAHIPG